VFAPDAVVWGEMPNTLANTKTQHARWENGRKEMARKYVPLLLSAAWNEFRAKREKRAFLLLDSVIEHLIPPFSILITASVFCLIIDIAALLGTRTLPSSLHGAATYLPAVNLIIGLISGQGLYILTGLRLAKAPKTVYRSLLLAPRYLIWKIWEYLSLFTSRGKNNQGWIRTMRNRG
jgi:cellulose synthase/poly-beta-1,6-N-acetylglucosamine synthase-like glycosyltransferase